MKEVKIYTTATCGYCKMLKGYLDQHEVKYSELRADEDQKLAQELHEKSGQLGVPFTIIEEDGKEIAKILGFDRPQIDQVLSLNQ